MPCHSRPIGLTMAPGSGVGPRGIAPRTAKERTVSERSETGVKRLTVVIPIHNEVDGISQRLTQRVKELAERFETPLP